MNSQFQKPSIGAKGGRASADVPPSTPDERPGPQPAGASGKSNSGGLGWQSAVGPAANTLDRGGSSFSADSGGKPVANRSLGSGDLGSKAGRGQSFGTSGMSDSGSDKFSSDDQSKGTPAGTAASGATGTDALIDETQDSLGKAAETVYAASDAAREATAQIADVAKEALAATVSAVTGQAAALTANITDELTQTAEGQKERGAEAMHRLAKAIRTAAGELDDGSPEIARQIRAAAGSVDALSSNLHGKSIGDLFNAASDFARNQPAAFFAGAVIAGFAFSRFLKSSGQPAAQPNAESHATWPAATPPPGTGDVTPSAPSVASF